MIQQYGLQRSGTNAVRAIVETNYDATVRSTGKHDAPAPPDVAAACAVLVSVRHPASWLIAYHRFRAMKRSDVGLAIDPIDTLAPGWLDHWATMTTAHLCAARRHGRWHVVTHDRLIRDPEGAARDVGQALDLSPTRDTLEVYRGRRMRRGADGEDVRHLVTDEAFSPGIDLARSWSDVLPRPVVRLAESALTSVSPHMEGVEP